MNAYRGIHSNRFIPHDNSASKKLVSRTLSTSSTLRHLWTDRKLSNTRLGSNRLSELTRSGFHSASLKDLTLGSESVFSSEDNCATSHLSDCEIDSAVLRRQRRRRLQSAKRHSQSVANVYQSSLDLPRWMAELRIFSVHGVNTSTFHDGTNTCIKIRQSQITLGRTSVKPASSQQVWEQTFTLLLTEVQTPLLLEFCSRKSRRFSTLGVAHLPLNDCLVDITYSKHLEIIGSAINQPIGMLRIQVCLRSVHTTLPLMKKNTSFDDGNRTHKSRLHLKQRSVSLAGRVEPSNSARGPLNAGVQIFEARYLGLLHLNVVSRPSNVYARRWNPIEYQPGEVAVITNPLTRATEIVSPRLPWPPHFLRGVSALEFDPVVGPQVAQFDSAVLYLNVLSACGLQSVPLSKFLNKCQASEQDVDSIHHGVMVAQLLSCYQSVAKASQTLSTQVLLQMGKDKFTTEIRKFTYDPVWNQTFTFNLTRFSKTLIEIHLMSISNPNIAGPAAGIEKIGEALIDISRLPMDFTQRIEVELSGNRPKPRLLLLATLTGLGRCDPPIAAHYSPPIVMSSLESNEQHSDVESNSGSLQSLRHPPLRRSVYSNSEEEWPSSQRHPSGSRPLDETDTQIVEHYGWKMALKNRFDVGYLRVSVIAASGLMNKETNGKCDPYCLLELINMRVRTHTARRTFNPLWYKVFVFPVTDIHAVLYVTVKDDLKSKSDFLGRVAIPLMKIRNHERSWYALKNSDLNKRSRGSVLLEFFFVYNHFKAAWRTLNPIEACLRHPVKPRKYKKLSVDYKKAMQDNVMRLKAIFKPLGMVSQFAGDIYSWENPFCTLAALVIYNVVVWNFQLYMVPLGMIVGILVSLKATKNPHPSFEVPSDTTPRSSFDCDDQYFIDNELLLSLEQEPPSSDARPGSEKHTSEPKESKQGKKKIAVLMDLIDELPQILDLIASAIEKTIGCVCFSPRMPRNSKEESPAKEMEKFSRF